MLLGIETYLNSSLSRVKDFGSCALLANQASLCGPSLKPSWLLLLELGCELKVLFSPQHGFDATVQDNMIETGHSRHVASGLPLYSLYSEVREPLPHMLEGVDTLLIDMQIVGCRVYTFKYTMAACMRAAKKAGVRVVVFDRPNPLGGEIVEGRVLDGDCRSFVGEFPIPMRHALTPGEACLFFNQDIGCELEVIKMSGWDPSLGFEEQQRSWVLTSPNLPTVQSLAVYPGTVLFEGTNVSEGRGTSLPFQQIGAPFFSGTKERAEAMGNLFSSDQAIVRPAAFQPTSQKWRDRACYGYHIIVRNPLLPGSFRLGLELLRQFQEDEAFCYNDPPYEYNFTDLPIHLILGSKKVDFVMKGANPLDQGFWCEGIDAYIERAQGILCYDRELKIVF